VGKTISPNKEVVMCGMIRVMAATRQQLISESLKQPLGKKRYNRRFFSTIEFPNRGLVRMLDINKWMKSDILDAQIGVIGETDNYVVDISFYGVWDNYVGELSPKSIREALQKAFRTEDVFLDCNCPDYQYRFRYQNTRKQQQTNEAEFRPANKTNPNDSLGSACKHVLLCLVSSSRWIYELANLTYKYIKMVEKRSPSLYTQFIAPRIEMEMKTEEEAVVEPEVIENEGMIEEEIVEDLEPVDMPEDPVALREVDEGGDE
jgi:hypothetical protein